MSGSCRHNRLLRIHGISLLFQSGPESIQSTSSSAAARPLSEEGHLLKKPKLELSPSIQTHDVDRGGVDNNNGSPTGSAFRPWNAEEEAGGSRTGVFNGDVAERKLDPYLIRGNEGSKFVVVSDQNEFALHLAKFLS